MKAPRPEGILLVAALAACAACSRQPAATAVTAAQPAPVPVPSPTDARTASGAVVEAMDASNYTYVRVKTASGEVWAATARFKVAVGDRVVVPLEMPMENFHSQSLNRDFPLIYFASRISLEGEPAAPPLASAHTPVGGSGPGAAASHASATVAPAAGGTRVADVWAKRAALAGKTVTVRGKVVKFNGGILDRNWLHVQDGSGSAADGSNDLTVTTTASVNVGDVITATGVVAIDRDFGAGYAYQVIIESATVIVK